MKKFLIFLGLIIIIVIAAGAIYTIILPSDKLTDSQKEEKLAKVLGRKVELTDKVNKPNVKYQDSQISFDYSGNAVQYDYKDPGFASTSGLLASFSYDLKDPRVVFNYAAAENKSLQTVEDDPSVRLRRIPSRGYQAKNVLLDNVKGVLFTKDETPTSERSIFILNNHVFYTFSFTGPDSKALDTFVSLLISTLKFK